MNHKKRTYLLAAIALWVLVVPTAAMLLGVDVTHKPSALWGAILGVLVWVYFDN